MLSDLLEMLSGVGNIFIFLGNTFIYWFPIVTGITLWSLWRRYIQDKYISDIKWRLLEIKLPKDIKRSPLAMEVVLNVFYQTSSGTWYSRFFNGTVRDWFTLEIVSFGGDIHFYIRTAAVYKNIVEAQIYAQYPTIEIVEVSDYVQQVDCRPGDDNSPWSMWGQEYALKKPDAYPIKTYVDFGLDREGIKDEEKIDPMTVMLEFMGSISRDEQLWFQINVQATNERFIGPRSDFGFRTKRDWKEEGQSLIEKIVSKYADSETGKTNYAVIPEGEKEIIKAIERNISKLGFDVGMRSIYFTKGKFHVGNIKGLLGLLRQYDSNELNAFRPQNATGVDFPWEDFKNIRTHGMMRRLFNAYKRRSYFYPPHKRKPMVLNSEELATIFHFPGQSVETPTVERTQSRKGEPPTNLPL